MIYDVDDVIKWILSKEKMTPKKLQKILYYSYSWYLTLQNDDKSNLKNRLFVNRFEAWQQGPSIKGIYSYYREQGFQMIPQYFGEMPIFDHETKDILDEVWNVYREYNGIQLASISRQETPWQNARKEHTSIEHCEIEISDEDIFEYYNACATT